MNSFGWLARFVLVSCLFQGSVHSFRCREEPLQYTIPERFFKIWGVPQNATIVMEYTSSCGEDAPPPVKPRLAVDCRIRKQLLKECLHTTEPTFVGRNCKGQTCTLSFPRADSSCFFRASGHSIRARDTSLAESCGVEGLHDLNRQEPLPNSNPFSDEFSRNCDEPLPPGVFGLTWTLCTKNGIQAKVELKFKAPMPAESEYTCLMRSECDGGRLTRQALCYVENLVGKDKLRPLPNHRAIGCGEDAEKDVEGKDFLGANDGCTATNPTLFASLVLTLTLCIIFH